MTSYKRFVRQYDRKALEILPEHCKQLRAELYGPIPRVPEDGDLEGVYMTRPKGHRAFWSCRWSTRKGLISARQLYPPESMTVAEIVAESIDYAYHRWFDRNVINKLNPEFLIPWLTGETVNPHYLFTGWIETLRIMRESMDTTDFVYPYHPFVPLFDSGGERTRDMGPVLVRLTLRPGWGDPMEVRRLASGGGLE